MAKIKDHLGVYWEQHAEGGVIQTKRGDSFIVYSRTGKYGPQSDPRLASLALVLAIQKHWNELDAIQKFTWFVYATYITNRIKKVYIRSMKGQNLFLMLHVRRALMGIPFQHFDPIGISNPPTPDWIIVEGGPGMITIVNASLLEDQYLEVFLEKPRVSQRNPDYKSSTFHSRWRWGIDPITISGLRPGWYGVHSSIIYAPWGTVSDFYSLSVEVT